MATQFFVPHEDNPVTMLAEDNLQMTEADMDFEALEAGMEIWLLADYPQHVALWQSKWYFNWIYYSSFSNYIIVSLLVRQMRN